MKFEDFNKIKALIVDDQEEARAVIANMLGELGVTQIFEASSADEAELFINTATDYVDVVICDWNMPAVSGLDLLKKVKTSHPEIPFLMVTGRGDFDSVMTARESGVSGYIRKPFSPVQLQVKLRVIMTRGGGMV